jgi:hypothetical protein
MANRRLFLRLKISIRVCFGFSLAIADLIIVGVFTHKHDYFAGFVFCQNER